MRLDKYLLVNKLVPSRSRALDLIKRGLVEVNASIMHKPAYVVKEADQVSIVAREGIDSEGFVGRGSLKLNGALKDFGISLKHKIVADIGASTGGFTEVCLHQGAKYIYAIDVGRDQLDPKLRLHPKVANLEKTNVRYGVELDRLCDFVLVDLSHISQKKTLESCIKLLSSSGELLSLFKPQFEVGRALLPRDGIVKDSKLVRDVLLEFISFANELGLHLKGITKSSLKGKKGNQEYFVYFSLASNS